MTHKIYIDGELTNLQLFAAVITQFAPPAGDLQCQQVATLAEDYHTASAVLAIHHPNWDLQSLTNVTEFAWFKQITLDSNCPQVAELRTFIIKDIKAIPESADEGTFHELR